MCVFFSGGRPRGGRSCVVYHMIGTFEIHSTYTTSGEINSYFYVVSRLCGRGGYIHTGIFLHDLGRYKYFLYIAVLT